MATVYNTLRSPDGAPVSASIEVRLIASTTNLDAGGFLSEDEIEILGRWVSQTNSSGEWSVELEPNDGIDPTGTFYEIKERYLPGKRLNSFYIEVPNSATPTFWVKDILITPPPALGGSVGPEGPQGIQGIQGDQGIQGIQGDQGEIGPEGPQGIQGIQGDQGEIGPEGPQASQAVYGSIYLDSPSGVPVTVTTAGVFYPITTATVGGISQLVTESTGGTLTVDVGGGGIYKVEQSTTCSGPNNAIIMVVPFKNGVEISAAEIDRKLPGTGDASAAASQALVTLNDGDVVDLRITSSSDGDVINVKHMSLTLTRETGVAGLNGVDVYVYDPGAATPGYFIAQDARIFIGPIDPVSEGFTLIDGDQWEQTP